MQSHNRFLALGPISTPNRLFANGGCIVWGLGILMLLTSCSASYSGERAFWKANRLSSAIVKNHEAATPEQFTDAIEAHQRVITEAAGTRWAARSQVAIGSLYGIQEQFEKAREAYALALKNYYDQTDLALTARYATAKTLELEGKTDAMLAMYKEIAEFHPYSPIGIRIPFYLGQIHQKLDHQDEAQRAYERAVDTYIRLAASAPSRASEVEAKGYLALTYDRIGQWDEAAKILNALIDEPEGVNRPFILLSLGGLYENRLKKPEKAEKIYTKLVDEFPEHSMTEQAKFQLENLGLTILPNSP